MKKNKKNKKNANIDINKEEKQEENNTGRFLPKMNVDGVFLKGGIPQSWVTNNQ